MPGRRLPQTAICSSTACGSPGSTQAAATQTRLLTACIADSKEKGKHGLVILAGDKKRPFLADPKSLRHAGFSAADTADPYYVLYYLPFDSPTPKPQFAAQVKQPHIEEQGFVLYYSHQCPFTAKYVPLIERIAQERDVVFRSVLFSSAAEAQNAPVPFTTYSPFYGGEFVTNEILSEKNLQRFCRNTGCKIFSGKLLVTEW